MARTQRKLTPSGLGVGISAGGLAKRGLAVDAVGKLGLVSNCVEYS